jgi:type IV pilus assembly protein PilN
MRLDINLASQPYEDARQFWMRWGLGVGVAGLFTLVLLTLTITGWVNAHRDHMTMDGIKKQIADRDHRHLVAEEFLNRPENRTTRDASLVLNSLIERKAFSWTLVLENLEKVMPNRVHLVSINPELDEDNQLILKMVVAGNSRDRAIELARRMEDSRRFAQTNIIQERSTQSTTGDTEQFDIAAVYIPETVPQPAAPAKTEGKSESKTNPESGSTKAGTAKSSAQPGASMLKQSAGRTAPKGKH